MYAGIQNKGSALFLSSGVLLAGAVCAVVPWHVTLLGLCIFIFIFICFVNDRTGVFFLIFLTMSFGHQLQVFSSSRWSTLSDRIGLFPFSILAILLAKMMLDRTTGLRDRFANIFSFPVMTFFVAWACISLMWSPNTKHAAVQLAMLIINVSFFFYLVNFMDQYRNLHDVVWWLILSAVCLAVTGHLLCLIENVTYTFSVAEGLKMELIIPGAASSLVAGKWRLHGIGWSTAETALILNFMTCISVGMFIIQKEWGWRKLALCLIIVFLVWSSLLTKARAGVVALVVMLHFVIFSFSELRKNALRYLLILYLIIPLCFMIQVLLLREAGPPRILASATSGAVSIHERLKIWRSGTEMLLDSSGLGGGVGSICYDVRPWPHGHNIWFDYVFDFGVVGVIFVLFLTMFLVKYYIHEVRQQENTDLGVMRLSLLTAFICVGIHGLLDFGYNHTIPIWIFLGLTVSAINLSKIEHGVLSQ